MSNLKRYISGHKLYLEIDEEDDNAKVYKSMRCRNEISLVIQHKDN